MWCNLALAIRAVCTSFDFVERLAFMFIFSVVILLHCRFLSMTGNVWPLNTAKIKLKLENVIACFVVF